MNSFAEEMTHFPLKPQKELGIHLEGARWAFLQSEVLLLALLDGSLYRVYLRKEGRIVQHFHFDFIQRTSIASSMQAIGRFMVFMGSRLGNAALYRYVEPNLEYGRPFPHQNGRPSKKPRIPSPKKSKRAPAMEEEDELDFLTADLHEEVKVEVDATVVADGATVSALPAYRLELLDELVVVGPVADFAVGSSMDDGSMDMSESVDPKSLNMVAVTGAKEESAITVITRAIRPHVLSSFAFGRGEENQFRDVFTVVCRPDATKEELTVKGSTDDVRGEEYGTSAHEDAPPPEKTEDLMHRFMVITGKGSSGDSTGETLIMDAGQELRERRDGDFLKRVDTVAMGNLFYASRVVQVVPTSIRLLNDQAQLTQELKVFAGGAYGDDIGKRIVAASIQDPFIVLQISDGSIVLVKGDPWKREVSFVDVPSHIHVGPLRASSSHYYRNPPSRPVLYSRMKSDYSRRIMN